MNCICNQCEQDMTIELQQRRIGELGIEENYFVCPHCSHEYISFYTDPEVRTVQREAVGLWERLRSSKSIAERENIQARIDSKQQKIQQRMEELRQLVADG